MKTGSIVAIGLLWLALGSCLAVELPAGSAFAPELVPGKNYSLLTQEETAREAGLDIYGPGLYLPFASWSRFKDAFCDAFRMGKASHSIMGYQSADSLLAAEVNIIAGYEYSYQDSSYGFLYKGLRVKSQIGSRFQLNSLWWNGVFDGDRHQALGSELIDGVAFDNKESLRVDNVSGDISYHAPHLSMALGRGGFSLGNSISGSIILNNSVNDYAYLLAEGQAGDVTLSFLHGTLKADYPQSVSSYANKILPDKYIALHQLTYQPLPSFSVFAGETVVYGNRSMDINYLLPNMFWRATEHNLGDRDNVLIYAGGKYRPHPALLAYGQVAFDEMSYSKLFTDWWGNKYAVQGGINWSLPGLYSHCDTPSLGLELTAVRPFTYTHYMNHTMYSHDGHSLGYAKGSNLMDATLVLNIPYSQAITLQSQASFGKYGSFGHDYRTNYMDIFPGALIDEGTATWFQGEKQSYTDLRQSLRFDLFAHHRLLLNYTARHEQNWDKSLGLAWQCIY